MLLNLCDLALPLLLHSLSLFWLTRRVHGGLTRVWLLGIQIEGWELVKLPSVDIGASESGRGWDLEILAGP